MNISPLLVNEQSLASQHSHQFASTNGLNTHNHHSPVLMSLHEERPVEEMRGWEDSPLAGEKIGQSSSSLALELSKEDYVYSDPETVDREAFWMRYGVEVEEASERRLYAWLGIINNLAYHVGRSCGAVSKDEKGQWVVKRDPLLGLKDRDFSVMTALCHTTDYIAQYWPQVDRGVNYIRDSIEQLVDLGFLAHHSEQSKGKRSRIYTFIDLPGLLLLAEMIERTLGFDRLPDHRGGMIQRMFNALFSGWGYNRKGHPGEQEPKTYGQSIETRKEAGLLWRAWINGVYQSAVSGYRSVVSVFGAHDPLASEIFEEIKHLAEQGRINQRKTSSGYEFVGEIDLKGGAS